MRELQPCYAAERQACLVTEECGTAIQCAVPLVQSFKTSLGGADGRLFLAFLFYGSYFANASAWSELSVTVSHLTCAIVGTSWGPIYRLLSACKYLCGIADASAIILETK